MTKCKLRGLKWKVVKLRGWVLHFGLKNNNSSKVVFRYSAVSYWIQCLWQSTHIWLSSNTKTTLLFIYLFFPIVDNLLWLEQH